MPDLSNSVLKTSIGKSKYCIQCPTENSISRCEPLQFIRFLHAFRFRMSCITNEIEFCALMDVYMSMNLPATPEGDSNEKL
jgi:hypothetical protein